VKANQADVSVRAMCKTLRVSPSGYYDWLDRPACAQAQANVVLLEQIRHAHAASDATYGVPRIQAELADQGIKAGHNRIAAVMRPVFKPEQAIWHEVPILHEFGCFRVHASHPADRYKLQPGCSEYAALFNGASPFAFVVSRHLRHLTV
jgi:HTH-like domain